MKKAQMGIIGFVFMVFVFLILYAVFFGKWQSEAGALAIQEAGLTGIEAFFYANLPLVTIIGLILGILGYLYFAGARQ